MRNTLKSASWKETAEKIRKCHLSTLGDGVDVSEWKEAFDSLIASVINERLANPTFATELAYLTPDSGIAYDIKDVLNEYFDALEAKEAWDTVIVSAQTLLDTFAWNNFAPSEYKYRIGNALMKSGRLVEAEEFGKKWMKESPNDLFAAASNSFLLMALGRKKEAKDIAAKFLDPNLVCDDETQTVFAAALSLYDATEDKTAKHIIETKIAEYNKLVDQK